MHSIKKKPYTAIFTLLLFISSVLSAQTNNPLINSGEIIQNGIKLHDEKKYEEAIKEIKKIDRSDTNYYKALYQISFSYYIDSQFNKSLEYVRLGLQLFPEKYSLFAMQAANSLDDMNRSEEAIKIYDSAMVKEPQDFLLYFNKGVVNYKLKNYNEAKKNMQQCLLINPYYSSAHYFLGSIYLLHGNLVPALLAFKTYLLISPSGKYYVNTINNLTDIAKVTDQVLEFVKNKSASKEDNFNVQQEILLSKLALDKQYKLKAELEDNIVRQIQVVDEKLEYNKNDKGFCMQFYAPFYINILKEGNFEAMIFYIFSGISNKKIETWNKNNKREKDAFIDKASSYFDTIKKTQVLDPAKREDADINYLYDKNNFFGKGSLSKDKVPHYIGKWDFYYENGGIQATGNFNESGEKNGPWVYYYENGQVKEKSNSVNGVLKGLAEGWFNNGIKWYSQNYSDGKINGEQTINYFNGKSKSIITFKDGLKNGPQRYYNFRGELTSVQNALNDKMDGPTKSYYPDGKIKNEINYTNDNEDGTYTSYYNSGGKYLYGEFKNGKRQSLWTTYFENGTISQKTLYQDNEITGEFTEYFQNGRLSTKGTYYKKKVDGKLESYDDDGKKYAEYLYEKGKLREVNFYDKAGNIISTTTTRKGNANIIFYNPDGFKISEGYFTKDGYKDGKFISYFNSGKISQESNWKNGTQDGPQADYYPDNKLKKTTNYKDGNEDGYIKDFHPNGNLNSEGWKVNGQKQQHLLYYNNIGDLVTKEYYLNDELSGYSEYFDPGNRQSIEYFYTNGWLNTLTQFDSTGKVMSLNKFDKGNGQFIYKNSNGKNSSVGNYTNYMLNGSNTYYFFDGSVSSIIFYKNDLRDSINKSYYYGGALKSEGKFKAGVKDGTWKYYFPNGKIKEEETYVDGNQQGFDKIYLADGSLDKVITYKNNQLEGSYDIYGEKGQLAVRFNFKADIIKSYQYEEKPGVMISPIPLKGAIGKVIAKYPNGKQSTLLNYMDNEQQGERKIFYSNGNIYSDGYRLNGYLHGSLKSYYPNGKIWKEENYVLGNLNGVCKSYYPNGKIEKEENFYNDENHGLNKYYDEQGKLKQTFTYYHGSLLSVK